MANRRHNRLRLSDDFYDSSTIVRIVNLLFATTIVTFFAYVLFFVGIGQAGNGGEYWGFSGLQEPHRAAADAFESRDYRFLRVKFSGLRTGDVDLVPGVLECERHPFGPDNQHRVPTADPMHGADSVRLAKTFAHRYNWRMARRLNSELGANCEVLYGY